MFVLTDLKDIYNVNNQFESGDFSKNNAADKIDDQLAGVYFL